MKLAAAGSVVVVGLVAWAASCSAEGQPKSRPAEDCGPLALYALHRVEGLSTRLDQVMARLPPPRRGGYSMKELRDASRALGLPLDGVYVGKDGAAIDRPVLAFLKVEGRGHFLVIRPVGHSGRLVQVIDSNQPPEVRERADVAASDQWTGIVLAPSRTSLAVPIVVGVAGASAAGCVVPIVVRRRRNGRGRA